MKRIQPQRTKPPSLIPDFCSGPALLFMAVVMELVAVCFTLASADPNTDLMRRLALLSLYLQWIGLCGGAALCGLRRLFTVARPGVVFLACWITLILIVMVLSNIAWHMGTSPNFGVLDPATQRVTFILTRRRPIIVLLAPRTTPLLFRKPGRILCRRRAPFPISPSLPERVMRRPIMRRTP